MGSLGPKKVKMSFKSKYENSSKLKTYVILKTIIAKASKSQSDLAIRPQLKGSKVTTPTKGVKGCDPN